MKYLRVRGWQKHQHYQDGRPIHWIKVWHVLLDDYEFNKLPEPSQLYLIKIWLLAGKFDNKLPFDTEYIQQRIGAKKKVDLDQMVRLGFLAPYESVRDRTISYPHAHEEKRRIREEKIREEKNRPTLVVPLAGDKSFSVPAEFLVDWKEAYVSIDCRAEIKKLIAWNKSNPGMQKTARGIKRHINFWLNRANNAALEKIADKATRVGKRFDQADYGESGVI